MNTNRIKTEALYDLTGVIVGNIEEEKEKQGNVEEEKQAGGVTLWAELRPVRYNEISQTDAACWVPFNHPELQLIFIHVTQTNCSLVTIMNKMNLFMLTCDCCGLSAVCSSQDGFLFSVSIVSGLICVILAAIKFMLGKVLTSRALITDGACTYRVFHVCFSRNILTKSDNSWFLVEMFDSISLSGATNRHTGTSAFL